MELNCVFIFKRKNWQTCSFHWMKRRDLNFDGSGITIPNYQFGLCISVYSYFNSSLLSWDKSTYYVNGKIAEVIASAFRLDSLRTVRKLASFLG